MPTEFWRRLGAPRTVCAPMVDASELAFRSLVEEHGCDLGYTPMMHGALMGRDDKYRAWQIEENFKEELDARNSEWVFGVLDRPGMADVNLDVVDEAGRGFSDSELAVQLAKVGPRSAPRRGDDDGGGAAASDPSSAVDLSAAAQCCPIYTVHRDVAFRYRTRRTRRVFSQFSGNIGTVVLAGARHVQSFCDAIDLNFGCPQDIARRGNYGAFLLEEWPIMRDLVSTLYSHLDIPVTCKIRKVGTEANTLALARMLQDHGAQVLTVHGRTRHQKQQFTGQVDWEIIRKIKHSLRIPVIANGGMENAADIASAFEATQADAVMSAEGLLENPALFSSANHQPDMIDMAQQYLDKCKLYPCDSKNKRKHCFDILFRRVNVHINVRDRLAAADSEEKFQQVIDDLRLEQETAGHSNEFYVAQPSWYGRHVASEAKKRAKQEAAAAAAEIAGRGQNMEDALDGGGCLFDEI